MPSPPLATTACMEEAPCFSAHSPIRCKSDELPWNESELEMPPKTTIVQLLTPNTKADLLQQSDIASTIHSPGTSTAVDAENWSGESKAKQRPRLLALHGRASNSQVSKMQIQNLGLDVYFDIEYLDGPLQCDSVDNEAMFGISSPFFSWVPDEASLEDISSIVCHAAEVAKTVDVIFGFSQGAAVALAAAAHLEAQGCLAPACVCVCPAGIGILQALHVWAISTDSLLCIGMRDPFKEESENMLSFLSTKATTLYMDSGHAVPKTTREDVHLHANLLEWCARVAPGIELVPGNLALPTCLAIPNHTQDELRHVTPRDGHDQTSQAVQWTTTKSWFDTDAASMLDLLTRQPSGNVALWDGAAPQGSITVTYGDLTSFIHGEGNLTTFGIDRGDIASYVVPEGPLSAVMFLTVSSHCNAAPLGFASTVDDMHAAFSQFAARMVITYHEVDGRVEEAERRATCDGHCDLGLKVVESTNMFAGSFRFLHEHGPAINMHMTLPISDSSIETHLILRTSGTTSQPKVVPLSMKSITANGCGIASSLGLVSDDVCINAMPLFHIGGLAASIFATLASGSSVICMPGFQPGSFVEMLGRSPHPSPTWYSAVPTIHLALMQYLQSIPEDAEKISHSLRFIRSGAAALSPQSAEDMRKLWGCPVLPTYSMTEQMPISQPPISYALSRPGSVGVPMVTVVIVDHCLRPMPLMDDEIDAIGGEICISGPTVMKGYKNNDEANNSSFFYLAGEKYFRTGDVGFLDRDGFLHLTGREKELIKVGGEQVSPFVIEDILCSHPSVQSALAFGIPNELMGEVVAASVVLKDHAQNCNESNMIAELKQLFVERGLPTYQIPRIQLVAEDGLIKLPSGKLSRKSTRNSFMQAVAVPQQSSTNDATSVAGALDDATLGIRFPLSLVVCLNHIGNHAWPFEAAPDPWSSFVTSARTIGDLGVVNFGMLAGMMMAVSVKEPIRKGGYKKFFESRLVPIHLIYLIACGFCAINRILMCPPENFQPYAYGSLEVCRATALNWSYNGTWVASLVLTLLALQAWPFGVLVWHISYYTWFSSAYQFCVFCFPFIHRILQRAVQQGDRVLGFAHLGVHALHYATLVFMEVTYLNIRFKNPEFANYFIWAGYMFPPFWAVRFASGVLLGLSFLKYHAQPSQKASALHWAFITDALTFSLLVSYALLAAFQVESKHRISTVSLLEDRMYCGVIPRLLTPIFAVWLYGLAVGRGYTAWLCRNPFLVSKLSPASYSIYLLHQPVFEWYSVVFKGSWWGQRKPGFEWFSPDPIELGCLETMLVIFFTILFSLVVTYIANTYMMGKWLSFVRLMTRRSRGSNRSDIDTVQLVLAAIEDLTGVRPELSAPLQDTGLASLGTAALVSILNTSVKIRLTAAHLVRCDTVSDVVLAVSEIQEKAMTTDNKA